MEQPIKIRNAAIKDLEIIFLFISHLEEMSFEFEAFKERYEENVDDPDCLYLVAVNENDKPLGFAGCHSQSLLHQESKVFEIQELYVAKNVRGLGIGKALTAALEEKLKTVPGQVLEVTIHSKRADARKFFSKLGFRQTLVKFVKEV